MARSYVVCLAAIAQARKVDLSELTGLVRSSLNNKLSEPGSCRYIDSWRHVLSPEKNVLARLDLGTSTLIEPHLF